MIQAQELRIGNYYKGASRGNIEIVTWQTLRDLKEGKLNILPIPLTEEILLKFGFEKQHNEDDFDYWFKKDFCDDILWEHSEGFCHNLNYGGDIKYVHQLQNLYFALTGEELIFKN